MIQIYFNTATYDEIEKDRRVTVEAQLGVIGGTMGLLTGFSIVSGFEIVYFIIRFILSLNQTKKKDDMISKFPSEVSKWY